jgi:hypothetical protein
LDELIDNDIETDSGKADKLSYWLEDWVRFLSYEPVFSAKSLRKYKRGEIIKLHLGFNLGSEEGGLHYAVVLDKDNSIHNPVLTVVPLTSLKPSTQLDHLHKGEVFLGNELFVSLNAKLRAHLIFIEETKKHLVAEMKTLRNIVDNDSNVSEHDFANRLNSLEKYIKESEDEELLIKKLKRELMKMKHGSIALVSQITTVSKIRIYDPKSNNDVLSGIKLSNENLDLIDAELLRLYTNTQI